MSKYIPILGCVLGLLLVVEVASVAAQERFIDNGDGTVTDAAMGLMWAQTDNHSDIFWNQTENWIKTTFARKIDLNFEDWRLPTLKELQSLYRDDPTYKGYLTDCGHEVKMIPQIKISCVLIWTSEAALGLPLAFNFYLGNPFTLDLTENSGCRVLPVRTIR